MSDFGTKFASTDVRQISEHILEVLEDMEKLAKELLKASNNLQANLQSDVSALAIEVSSEMLKSIESAKKITIDSTSTLKEGAMLGEEIETLARKESEKL